MEYIKLHCDGSFSVVPAVGSNPPGNEVLEGMIGCDCIEIVKPRGLPSGFCLVVDESGLLRDKPKFNPIASGLYGFQVHGQPIYGIALVAKLQFINMGYSVVPLEKADTDMLRKSNEFRFHLEREEEKKL